MTTPTQIPIVTNSKMTSDTFFKIISLPENELQKQSSNNIDYWQPDKNLRFQGIEFENSIEFNYGFICIYELTFVSCKFKSFQANEGIFNKNITFENCDINIFKVENKVSFLNQLNIGKNSQINIFQLSGGHYNDAVYLDNSTIKKSFLIKGDCIFEENLFLTGNTFETHVKIWGGHFKKYLPLFYSEFKKDLSFQNVNFEKSITFFNEIFEGSELRFESGKFSDILISGGSYDSIIFSGGDFEKIYISGPFTKIEKVYFDLDTDININDLEIDFTESNCKTYKFESLIYKVRKGEIEKRIIKNICLKGIVAKDVYCEFSNFNTPNKIDFDSLTNYGNIYFKDVKPLQNQISDDTNIFRLFIAYLERMTQDVKPLQNKISDSNNIFRLFNSDLGKTTFMGSDFSNLYLDFQSSKITESFISESLLPKKPLRKHFKSLSKKEKIFFFNQQRSAFSQIKKIYENGGDTVTALKCYVIEMDLLKNNPELECGEYFNLTLSKLSTNHATDWLWGLGSTIGASILMYFLFCLSINIYPTVTGEGWQYFLDTSLPTYFEFLNPLHKSKEIVSNLKQLKIDEYPCISGLTSFTDFMSKIIITYCQFQLVQAFRKHGKK